MEFSFYGHAFFYYIRVFLFHDGGTGEKIKHGRPSG